MTKQEFFKTLMNNQVMPLATIDVMHEARGMYSLYVRQRNAPNCALSRHCDGSKTGQDMHGKYLDWMHEYAVKFDELVDAAHAEALAINETMNIIADDQAQAAAVVHDIDMDIAVGIAHAEALKENVRFDELRERFDRFARWYPGTRKHVIEVAHQEALRMDKAYDEANAEPEHIGRGLFHASMYCDPKTLPYCRCTIGCPVFEPLIVDLRQLYGESLRDYWQFATEEDRAELVEEQHALALGMDMQRDFYRFPLVLRIVAVGMAHVEALRMNRQIDFFRMPLYQRVSEIEWAHFEALVIDREHDELVAVMWSHIELLRQAMPAIINMTFALK